MFSFIPSIYRKVLRFIRMSSINANEDCEIPPINTHNHILNYCKLLQAEYNNQGPNRMTKFTVDEVHLYKTKGGARHEYVSARASDGSRTIYLAFERVRGEVIDKVTQKDDPTSDQPASANDTPQTNTSEPPTSTTPATVPLESTPPKSSFKEKLSAVSASSKAFSGKLSTSSKVISDKLSDLSARASISSKAISDKLSDLSTPASTSSKAFSDKLPTSSKPSHNADDIVTYLTKGETYNEDDECFRSMFFSPPIPLYKVALLARTLHTMKRHYLLFSDNCYYYAGTMMKCLQEFPKKDHNPRVYVNTTGSAEVDGMLKLRRIKKGLKRRDQAGTWFGAPVYAAEEVDTTPILQEFDDVRKTFEDTVQEHVDRREADERGRRAAEEETARIKKAAEEERKAKDEEIAHVKKAAAEAHKAATEAHKAAEAKQTAKDKEIARIKKAAEEGQKASEDEIARLRELLKGAGIPIPTPTTAASI